MQGDLAGSCRCSLSHGMNGASLRIVGGQGQQLFVFLHRRRPEEVRAP